MSSSTKLIAFKSDPLEYELHVKNIEESCSKLGIAPPDALYDKSSCIVDKEDFFVVNNENGSEEYIINVSKIPKDVKFIVVGTYY